MTEDEVKQFLTSYGAAVSQSLSIPSDRIHVKGGEDGGGFRVTFTIAGVGATQEQIKKVREYLARVETDAMDCERK